MRIRGIVVIDPRATQRDTTHRLPEHELHSTLAYVEVVFGGALPCRAEPRRSMSQLVMMLGGVLENADHAIVLDLFIVE